MGSIRRHPRLVSTLLVAMATLLGGASASATVPIEPQPLFIGSTVPGNLILVPSVEFPTVISVANIGIYATNGNWVGYFDSNKCYGYQFSAVESERHFFPVGPATASTCAASAGRWSGHFLNWAATQTIDPFRSALTGGNRVRDTPSETFLQKGRMDRDNQANFPRRTIAGALVTGATPSTWANFNMRIDGLGQRMWFTSTGNVGIDRNNAGTVAANVVAYDPAVHALDASPFLTPSPVSPGPVPRLSDNVVYEVSVRVKVCDPGAGLEPNCVRYDGGYKPEGLIQEYSNRVRYAMLGYLNDSSDQRDGGVLRANIKYVGPVSNDPVAGPLANAAAEWDGATGVFVRNPDAADAAATNARLGITTIQDSGIINYLNKFGEVSNTRVMKSIDPVSELYYAALRYVKNQGDVAAYSNITDATLQGRFETADGFPVIRNPDWIDPIQYSCQANVLLGIGDTNTHVDKNLPGPTSTFREPARPPEVTADTTVDVVAMFERIRAIEPGLPAADANQFAFSANSAYIASLAYHANTQDIRPDMPGRQSAQTYWVDVLEFQNLAPRVRNQYWLATKYGGFRVPSGFDPITNAAPIPAPLWNSTGENLAAGYPRPDNFFPARDAANMVTSLRRAFANIAAQVAGSGASFAANTTRLEVGARAYQAQFFSGAWHGDIKAFDINPVTGAISDLPVWSASARLATTAAGTGWETRRVFVNNGSVPNNVAPPNFVHGSLSATQQGVLTAAQVDFLRGSRAGEGASLRLRSALIGDIVHSEPVYVGAPNTNLYRASVFSGAATYPAFASTQATRRKLLYAGANDGMLHAFDADTGDSAWAFVPATAIGPGLRDFTLPDYVHQYTVDGEMTVADVYIAGAWRTVLVGTMGRGKPGVFALNITDPNNPRFMWEINQSTVPALGNNLGKPIIAQVADGQWRVLMGNGPNGAGSTAQLLQINVADGNAIVENTGEGGSLGLSAVQAWDEDRDGFTDTAYAGDFEGNLWKFSGLGGAVTKTKLFTARRGGSNQPITAAPLTARNPSDGTTWVFFGTGRYLAAGDLTDNSVNSWYGLRDDDTEITGRNQLAERRIVAEATLGGRAVRVIEPGETDDFLTKRGWYIDLLSPVNGAEGERMVVPNRFQGLVLVGTSRIPDGTDVCNPSGRGFIMAIDPFTGGRLGNNFFDINADGLVNPSDSISVNGVLTPVSGLGFNSSPNNPIFVGSAMLVTFDDGTSASVQTSQGGLGVRRASWRELIVP